MDMATGIIPQMKLRRGVAYRRALVDVAKDLTREEIKALSWECTFIDRSNQDNIHNGIQLLDAMEESNFISETDVTRLVNILKKRNFIKAASILDVYQQDHLNDQEDDVDMRNGMASSEGALETKPEAGLGDNQECCTHEQKHDGGNVNSEAATYALTVDRNKTHERVSDCGIADSESGAKPENTNHDRNSLLQTTKEKCRRAKDLCSHHRSFQERTGEQVKTLLQDACYKTRQSIDYSHNDLMIKLQKIVDNYKAESETSRSILTEYHQKLDKLENNIRSISTDPFIRWRQLKDVKIQVDKLLVDLEGNTETIRKREFTILYQKVPNSTKFFDIQECSGIGGLMINQNQMVHLLDRRVFDGSVLLICFDISDSTKEYWRYKVKPDNHVNPMVVSNVHLWYTNRRLILFAIGKTVFIIQAYHECPIYRYVEKVSTIQITDIPEFSWITSLAAHNPQNDPYDKFVITSHGCQTVKEYDLSGELQRKIDIGHLSLSTELTCLAYCFNSFAITCRDKPEVMLATLTDEVKITNHLTLQSNDLLPVIVICMGGKWWVLFVGGGEQKIWKVVAFDEEGNFEKICEEGRAIGGMDLPISLDIWQRDGFVSFANSNLRNFAIN